MVTDANCNDHLCRHDGEEWAKIILMGQTFKCNPQREEGAE